MAVPFFKLTPESTGAFENFRVAPGDFFTAFPNCEEKLVFGVTAVIESFDILGGGEESQESLKSSYTESIAPDGSYPRAGNGMNVYCYASPSSDSAKDRIAAWDSAWGGEIAARLGVVYKPMPRFLDNGSLRMKVSPEVLRHAAAEVGTEKAPFDMKRGVYRIVGVVKGVYIDKARNEASLCLHACRLSRTGEAPECRRSSGKRKRPDAYDFADDSEYLDDPSADI